MAVGHVAARLAGCDRVRRRVEGDVRVGCLEDAAGCRAALGTAAGLAAQQRVQEATTEGSHGQEVQVEVDGVVEVAQHVRHLLGEVVL